MVRAPGTASSAHRVLAGASDEFAAFETGASAVEGNQVGMFMARQRSWADSMSLNAMASPAARSGRRYEQDRAGLITHETDAFRRNRSAYRIAEPLLTFYHAIMSPAWGDLERPGRSAQVWRRSQHTFTSNVVGRHFEEICRRWARWYGSPQTYRTDPVRVASGTVPDAGAQKTAEVDVAVFGRGDDNRDTLLAIGEAKWQENMTTSHLNRLERIRDLLRAGGKPGAGNARLLLFSGTGFNDALMERAANDPSVQLIGLERLYYGS